VRTLRCSDGALQVSKLQAGELLCYEMFRPTTLAQFICHHLLPSLCRLQAYKFLCPIFHVYFAFSPTLFSLCPDQYSLGPSKGLSQSTAAAVDDAIKDGSKWVLKPQREGGGNNLYGSDLSEFLSKNKNDPVLSGADHSIVNPGPPCDSLHCSFVNILLMLL
jgi:Eukaryotic glutathione synthase, ATP binding domain